MKIFDYLLSNPYYLSQQAIKAYNQSILVRENRRAKSPEVFPERKRNLTNVADKQIASAVNAVKQAQGR